VLPSERPPHRSYYRVEPQLSRRSLDLLHDHQPLLVERIDEAPADGADRAAWQSGQASQEDCSSVFESWLKETGANASAHVYSNPCGRWKVEGGKKNAALALPDPRSG
jgi:hypothetical protein